MCLKIVKCIIFFHRDIIHGHGRDSISVALFLFIGFADYVTTHHVLQHSLTFPFIIFDKLYQMQKRVYCVVQCEGCDARS